jgi:hypothetical protein
LLVYNDRLNSPVPWFAPLGAGCASLALMTTLLLWVFDRRGFAPADAGLSQALGRSSSPDFNLVVAIPMAVVDRGIIPRVWPPLGDRCLRLQGQRRRTVEGIARAGNLKPALRVDRPPVCR